MSVLATRQHCEPPFLRVHLWLPLLLVASLLTTIHLFGLDFWLADQIYALEGNGWSLKHNLFTESLIHQIGKQLSLLLWLGIAAILAFTWRRPNWHSLRRPLLTLLLTTLIASSLIAGIKSFSHMDCPWDLSRYGGDRAFIGLFQLRPADMPRGSCWPAGHSSAGYCWVSMYFFLLAVRPRWRWYGLAFGLGLGMLFGFSQQLRGAHFLSHDLVTLSLCWFVSLLGYLWAGLPRSIAASRVPTPRRGLDPGEAVEATTAVGSHSCGANADRRPTLNYRKYEPRPARDSTQASVRS